MIKTRNHFSTIRPDEFFNFYCLHDDFRRANESGIGLFGPGKGLFGQRTNDLIKVALRKRKRCLTVRQLDAMVK